MSADLYSPNEQALLEAWFAGRQPTLAQETWLAQQGFEDQPCEPYTRLDAWVGAFAVRDIQERLPNTGIVSEDSVILTRPINRNRRSKKVAGAARFLFQINWADTAPGYSWPVDFHLVWLPEFDRWLLIDSADSPDARGYCDFALGSIGPEEDWRAAVRGILVDDWRYQFNQWDQAPWAYVWRPGLVTTDEAMAWRAEAWAGHDEYRTGSDEDDVQEEDVEEARP